MENEGKKRASETENANRQINEEFYGERKGIEEDSVNQDKVTQANLKINEQSNPGSETPVSTPVSYQNNNMAAVDVTKKDKRKKEG